MPEIRTMADIAAIEATPLSGLGLPTNTYDMIRAGAAINPSAVGLLFFLQGTAYQHVVRYTYRDILASVHRTANLFTALGVGQNDVVSLVLPNVPQTFFAIWGAEAAGIANPINPLLEASVIADIMAAAETKVLVTLAPFPSTDIWQKIAPILDKVPTLQTVLQVDLAGYLTGVKKIAVSFIRRSDRKKRGQVRILDFDATMKRQPSDRLVSNRVFQPGDVASYFHTGGTTGIPKIACHTHFNEVYDAWAASQSLQMSPGKTMFAGLPLFHVNGYLVTGLVPWGAGSTVVLGTPAGYRGEGVITNFWKIVERYHVNFFSGVPTVFSSLLNVPIGKTKIDSLEFAICGAAPMPVEVFTEFEKRTGLRILEGYGLTEGTCVCSVNPSQGERRIGSIGFRLPYQEMKAVVMEGDRYLRDCGPDEIGLVIVRGPNVFSGYKEDRHNKDAWVDTGDGQGLWLNTGDLGRCDADGYFWLTGRKKDLIIRGGHNIDPQVIEGPLYEHPAVKLAAAVGRPDPRVGEIPVAYVELKPDATATEDELMAFAEAHIGERAAIPKRIHVVAVLPLTAVGKIQKTTLVYRETEDAFTGDVRAVAGVASVTVEVVADKQYGMIAHVHVASAPGVDQAALREHIDQALGRYSVHYTVEIA